MDNLSVHKSKWVRDLVERRGCQLWLLPSYSPDMNPIEEAFSKAKNLIRKAKARTLEALFAVTARALEAVTAKRTPVASSRPAATGHLGATHYENRSRPFTSLFLHLYAAPQHVGFRVWYRTGAIGRFEAP
jgi:hypothetical protein